MKRLPALFAWLLALALVWPLFKPLVPRSPSPEQLLGRLPVLEGGRVKPFDSMARATLLVFRGKQSIATEQGRVSATSWMSDLLFNHEAAHNLPVFRIDHPDILGLFGLEPTRKKYFSYRELEPWLARIQDQARLADSAAKQRSAYENAVLRLFNNLVQYQQLAQTVYPMGVTRDVAAYYAAAEANLMEAARRLAASGVDSLEAAATPALRLQLRLIEEMSQSPLFLIHEEHVGWTNPGNALRHAVLHEGRLPESLRVLARLAAARQAGDTQAWVEAAQELLAMAPPIEDARPGLEYYFKQSQPFMAALGLYVWVALLVFLGWLLAPPLFLPAAYGILLVGLGVHTFGLILRVLITGYAPVTNLYSSAVFTGWVAVVLSVALEWVQRKGYATVAAAVVGFLTLLVAHHLAASGDTMEKMRAVLNSNFWLGTHVTTIIMGYGATFLAGFLGLLYIFTGWVRRGLLPDTREAFHRMIYGTVCFALLFSFIGTVLGGIWADQSWGRFWGWDPKENGALMIVLLTALILHALRGGLIRTRGLVHLAIVGNMVTAWSWFGTNMLGVGLHSYGFMDSAFFWLILFWLSQLLVMALEGLFPVRLRKG